MASLNHVCQGEIVPVSATTNYWNIYRAHILGMIKAGWRVVASSNGTTKTVSTVPTDNAWLSAVGTIGTVKNAGGSGAVIAAPVNGRALITGLTGLISSDYVTDKGNFFRDKDTNKYYQIEEVIGPSSCRVNARDLAVTTGSGINWEIRDPLTDPHPAGLNTVACWVLLHGPEIIRVSTTADPSAILPGEYAQQAATGAEGLVLGSVWYANLSQGFVMLDPTVRGSGAGRFGFDTSDITGAVSGVAVTPSLLDGCVTEMQFAKTTNQTQLSIVTSCVLLPTEAATALITLAANGSTTATVPPAAQGLGNPEPVTAGQLWPSSGNLQYGTIGAPDTVTTGMRRGISSAADAIPEAGQPADGSFFIAHATDWARPYRGFWFTRSDGAGADCHPYTFCAAVGSSSSPRFGILQSMGGDLRAQYWSKKGLPNGGQKVFSSFVGSNVPYIDAGSENIQVTPDNKLVVTPILIQGPGTISGSYEPDWKGFPRWMWSLRTSSTGGTSDNALRLMLFRFSQQKQFIALGVSSDAQSTPSQVMIGPWNGVTPSGL